MPRGVPKTRAQRMRESESDKRWLDRRNKEKPLRSPCHPGRRYHRFRSNKVRGPLNINNPRDAERTCWWCKKTFAQVKQEQKTPREMSESTNKSDSAKGDKK